MSEFTCPIVTIGAIEKHPNADTLSTTQVEGETVVIRTGDYKPGDVAIYVPVDGVIPETVPGTEFLGKHRRIRAMKLRGIYSEGLLLPAKTLPSIDVFKVGADVGDLLGIKKHEDVAPASMGGGAGGSFRSGGEQESAPHSVPVYDVESGKKYGWVLEAGEEVVITEKLHGTNSRFAILSGKPLAGSRNYFWKDPQRPATRQEKLSALLFKLTKRWGRPVVRPKDNLYWQVVRQYNLHGTLSDGYDGIVLYGEIFGQVQDLKYDAAPGQVWLRIFDIWDHDLGEWMGWDEVEAVCHALGLDTVPVLYRGPYVEDMPAALAEGKSTIASCIREGVVVKPVRNREVHRFGRAIVKWVGQGYKLRKGETTEFH